MSNSCGVSTSRPDLNWLSGMSVVQLQAMLASARAALSQLMMGQSPMIVVDSNGERVQFVPTDARTLTGFVQSIQGAIYAAQNASGGGTAIRGPYRFLF